MDNVIISACCSPPSCCFEIEVFKDLDGKEMVAISDNTGGVAIDTKESFNKVIAKYIYQEKVGFL